VIYLSVTKIMFEIRVWSICGNMLKTEAWNSRRTFCIIYTTQGSRPALHIQQPTTNHPNLDRRKISYGYGEKKCRIWTVKWQKSKEV